MVNNINESGTQVNTMIFEIYSVLKKNGLIITFKFIKEIILFDIINKTETRKMLVKENYEYKPSNFVSGVSYMASWTSEIKLTFYFLLKLLNFDFTNYDFIDVGSGKGKVLCVWGMLLKKNLINQNIYGVEYYGPLVEVCKNNIKKFKFKSNIEIITEDIINIDFNLFKEKLILFLYNPFELNLLNALCKKIDYKKKVIIIYVNPLHKKQILKRNYSELLFKKGIHYNDTISILMKS